MGCSAGGRPWCGVVLLLLLLLLVLSIFCCCRWAAVPHVVVVVAAAIVAVVGWLHALDGWRLKPTPLGPVRRRFFCLPDTVCAVYGLHWTSDRVQYLAGLCVAPSGIPCSAARSGLGSAQPCESGSRGASQDDAGRGDGLGIFPRVYGVRVHFYTLPYSTVPCHCSAHLEIWNTSREGDCRRALRESEEERGRERERVCVCDSGGLGWCSCQDRARESSVDSLSIKSNSPPLSHLVVHADCSLIHRRMHARPPSLSHYPCRHPSPSSSSSCTEYFPCGTPYSTGFWCDADGGRLMGWDGTGWDGATDRGGPLSFPW